MALKATAKAVKALKQNAERALQLTIEGEVEDVTPAKKRAHPEEDQQILLFDKRALEQEKHPLLKRLFATLNGVYIPGGLLNRIRLGGLTRGILDVWLPVPMIIDGVQYVGCVLDLKTAKGRPTPEQLEWAEFLKESGWRVYFCNGIKSWLETWQEAWLCLCHYLGFYEPAEISEEDRYKLIGMGRKQNERK